VGHMRCVITCERMRECERECMCANKCGERTEQGGPGRRASA
jgi:hypothetical protein